MSKQSPPPKEKKLKEAGALEELFGFIEESISEGQYFFKFQDLYEMLDLRLKSVGIESEKNRTRLKERILLEFPDASEQMVKKQVVISFPEGIKKLVKEEMETRDLWQKRQRSFGRMCLKEDVTNSMGRLRKSARRSSFPTHCK